MRFALLILFVLGLVPPLSARGSSQTDFQPDPKSVQRHGPAYRYPQAGWIVLHIEGAPYDRGYQHGRLLASEIAAYVRCFAALQSPKAPAEGWKSTRLLVNALFVRRFDPEYLEEMKGIADGAAAAGARFDDRPIDLMDIIGINCWPEIETLDSALEATPTGLEGRRFPHQQPRAMPPPKPMHCSAFAATGPATADGKIVFGHITMFSLYPSLFYNVWLDVQPAKGHRVLMQSFPGGIQSGMDYYMNDAGLLVCETTIAQTRFDSQGMTLASRIRQALQYADSIDKAVAVLKANNNGLYTNEWLLADIKTNEIAMFELGTHKTKLYRSSQNDWFGGTEGFYWGCNNAKDLDVRLETVSSVKGRPANVVWRPSDRDQTWMRLYQQHKGKIDADFGKLAFTTPPLAAYHSLDAKVTTSALAKELKTWALFGSPLGRTWKPTQDERQRFPEIRPMASNPWCILHAQPPANIKVEGAVTDLRERVTSDESHDKSLEEKQMPTVPVWHGTLLPKTDADIWLAVAFADYEKLVARENQLRDKSETGKLTSANYDQLTVDLFAFRSKYLAAARAAADVPLLKTRPSYRNDNWYRMASGKGVLLLHEMRQLLGNADFDKLMNDFGRDFAGKEATTAEFRARAEKLGGTKLNGFFDYWLFQTNLPQLTFKKISVSQDGPHYVIAGVIQREQGALRCSIDVTIETDQGEVTRQITSEIPETFFQVVTDHRPQRVRIDPNNRLAKANGGAFSVHSFHAELEQTLIVYGTADEAPANREAAEALQRAIIERHSNFSVPIKSDREVSEEDLKTHHLLLTGRPNSNGVIERFRSALPITFGYRSFMVRRESFAHPGSCVIAAAENPLNRRYSLVVLAGLSADATLQAPAQLLNRGQKATEVFVFPHGGKPRALVISPRELTYEFDDK